MQTPQNPLGKEQSNTYFVQNRSMKDEQARLLIQDHLLTTGMGGVLPEQADASRFQKILDVGCGTGGWLLEAASAYPTMTTLVGIDMNKNMVEYAQAQAEAQGLAQRVQFRVMDALQALDFSRDIFDLINLRFGLSWIRTWDWQHILGEFNRIARRDAIVRLTEADLILDGPAPAFTQLNRLLLQAFHASGHYFTLESNGLTDHLAHVLQRAGIQDIQTRVHRLEYRAGTAEGEQLYEDTRHLFRNIQPFLRKWTRMPETYDALYQQALQEMQQPDFFVTWRLLTAWGTTHHFSIQDRVLP